LYENRAETAQKEKQYTEQYTNTEYTFRHNYTLNRSAITHARFYTETNKQTNTLYTPQYIRHPNACHETVAAYLY
jgi:hypothetical protein